MVPTTTTRKVAINTVRYETQTVSRQVPVTVMRQVPIGSTIAFNGGIYSGTTTALAPQPDGISEKRTANAADADFGDGSGPKKFDRKASSENIRKTEAIQKLNYVVPQKGDAPTPASEIDAQAPRTRVTPSVVRVGQWTAAKRPSVLDAAPVSGPAISVANIAN
jgi:hypothetical protein